MTRICSQLTNSKLPLQGQKNVEVKEEKNDEKNLYRDISTPNFRKKWIFRYIIYFEKSAFQKFFVREGHFRGDGNFEKTIYSRSRRFRTV